LNAAMGRSGCGKSTLAYILSGYVEPEGSTLTLDGGSVKGVDSGRMMVFQETLLWPWMTVEKNVTFGARAKGIDKKEAADKAAELLDRFGLGDFCEKYPGQLSGGMMRRAELAQAPMNSPKVMILDDPFRGLDVMTRELMQENYLQLFEDTQSYNRLHYG